MFRAFVNNAIDPPVLLVAQLSLVGVTPAGLPAGRGRVVLHDVVVPVDHPNLAVRLSHECRAVPVLPWITARRVERMACAGREMAVPVNLADLIGDRIDGCI